MTKKKKFEVKALYTILSIVAVLGICSFAIAYSINSSINVEGDYNNYEAEQVIPEDFTIGAVVGPDIYNKLYFHDGFMSNSTIDIPLTPTGTSTAANPGPAGYWCNNTNEDLLIDSNWYTDFQTAGEGWSSNWTIGTTTLIDGTNTWIPGTNSFTNTSTDTLFTSTLVGTTTTGFYQRDALDQLGTWYDDGGNATTAPWVLEKNVCLVGTSDISGATSSDESFTVGGGESAYVFPVINFHAEGVIR